jgi:hypothetical protein
MGIKCRTCSATWHNRPDQSAPEPLASETEQTEMGGRRGRGEGEGYGTMEMAIKEQQRKLWR